TRREIVKNLAPEYRKATKKEKGKIIDTLVPLTGYHRTYASWLLSHHGRTVLVRGPQGHRYRVGGTITTTKRNRPRKYDATVFTSLKKIWAIFDCPCGKRLAPSLCWMIEKLALSPEVRSKLCSISPAMVDRLLHKEKQQFIPFSRPSTKPGTLLKHRIPIRTYAEWNENTPGFCEMDLVAHDGGDPRGDYCQTLDVVAVSTSWTETEAVKNKAQKWVFQAFTSIRQRLPLSPSGHRFR
ncbi:MAG TPA: ISNCY family transposase, partial [Atribacteraceae bacterium]|nr:ISNCY family transposase [Atribacteraceae bacterium]